MRAQSLPGGGTDDSPAVSALDLIRRIGLGDRASFDEFFFRHAGLVYATALRILGNEADAEDVVQDVLFRVWEKAPMYDASRGNPSTWVVAMARNRAIDLLRSHQRRHRLQEEFSNEGGPDAFVSRHLPRDDADLSEQAAALMAAIPKLKPEQREVIHLAFFEDLSQGEISARLRQPLGTVKARIRRGLLRLKQLLHPSLRS